MKLQHRIWSMWENAHAHPQTYIFQRQYFLLRYVENPLLWACKKGYYNIVRALLAQITYIPQKAMAYALRSYHFDIIDLLHRNGIPLPSQYEIQDITRHSAKDDIKYKKAHDMIKCLIVFLKMDPSIHCSTCCAWDSRHWSRHQSYKNKFIIDWGLQNKTL